MTAPSDPTGGLEPIRQIAMEMMRRCGTCRWWEREEPDETPIDEWSWGVCRWVRANLPASMRFADLMRDIDGTDCATWKDRADGE